MNQSRSGRAEQPGAYFDGDGVSFTLFSSVAERVELCLFDRDNKETSRHPLIRQAGDQWTGYQPSCHPGQHYGYRVHGRYQPDQGLRCNPAKLLIDPYARRLAGKFQWNTAVYDYLPGSEPGSWQINHMDSAPFVPKSVVSGDAPFQGTARPEIPWSEAIIYEANVRGFTMRHPDVDEQTRGRFRGMTNGRILEYLKALGITTLELQPVYAYIDEAFLSERGLRNFWAYNSINFFTPDARFAGADPVFEFQEMVNAIHGAGIEVFLDVAYNHTGEGDQYGPNLSFRGIDNLAYYRTEPDHPGQYINDTGTGNTINADQPWVRQLVIDSLSYWHREMGVDGFRFDLATILGRGSQGFESTHPLLMAIEKEPRLTGARMIAEPWDPGPGGYQLGGFSGHWSEWNDRYRDSLRAFWRGDEGQLAELARRLHGSSDLFEASGRGPCASINFIASHDGFTLMDTVSYSHKHNEANTQNNQDGHGHNLSCHHGEEGHTRDPAINATRRHHRLNLLATLLFSQGTPMLLAGDEFGNSQQGNNNAYAQDNETGWLDWSGLDSDPAFTAVIKDLISIRKRMPLLHLSNYLHPDLSNIEASDIAWLKPGGAAMEEDDWMQSRAVLMLLKQQRDSAQDTIKLAILVNGHDHEVIFHLPGDEKDNHWQLEFCSDLSLARKLESEFAVPKWSIACLCQTRQAR